MSPKEILLWVEDEEYGNRLYAYLQARKDRRFHFQLLQQGEKEQAVLPNVDFVIYEKGLDVPVETRGICIQTEKEADDGIFKYQSGASIYQALCSFVTVPKKPECVTTSPGQVCVVFSPEGETPAIQYSISLAKQMGCLGNTLYIPFSGFPVLLPEGQGDTQELETGLSELILATGEDERGQLFERGTFSYENFKVLCPARHYKDLLDISLKDLLSLIDFCQHKANVDNVVIFMSQLFEYTFDVMEQANHIYVPVQNQLFDDIRVNVLRGYLRMEGRDDILERLEIRIWEEEVMLDEYGSDAATDMQ